MKSFLVALFHVCALHHSGQWSKGYRLMCLANTYHKRWYGRSLSLDTPLTTREGYLFNILAEKYGNEL